MIRLSFNLISSTSYRRLALKYHPARNKTDIAANTYKFTQIAEAYEVLSDPAKKAIYDQYGETVLKEGLPGKAGKSHCYRYSGNAAEIFEKFFGTDNPFIDVVDGNAFEKDYVGLTEIAVAVQMEGSMLGSAYGGAAHKPPKAPDDLTVTCECTLEELYMGCMKKVAYETEVLALDGKTTKKKPGNIEIEIKPGQSADRVIRFVGKGNEGYSYPTCKN